MEFIVKTIFTYNIFDFRWTNKYSDCWGGTDKRTRAHTRTFLSIVFARICVHDERTHTNVQIQFVQFLVICLFVWVVGFFFQISYGHV